MFKKTAMTNSRYANIKPRWFSSDLDCFRSGTEFKVLSVHKDVINLVSGMDPSLLMIAVEGPVRGPSTIGLAESDFFYLGSLISGTDCFSLEKNELIIKGSNYEFTVNLSCGEKLSFAVDDHLKNYRYEPGGSYIYYEEILKSWPSPGASAVLLNLPGGDEYFRSEFMTHYPCLVQALFAADEEEFVNRCRKIIGMGRGLTPTGDDLIHAALVTFRSFRPSFCLKDKTGDEMRSLYKNTTRHGSQMIETGLKGLTVQPSLEFLTCLKSSNACSEKLTRLLQIGSSTGFDLAAAMIYTAKIIAK